MLRWIFLSVLFLAGCGNLNPSKALAEEADVGISEPFAKGEYAGVDWQLRLNRAQCNHPPHPPTFCTNADRRRVADESGTEKLILSWISDPQVTSIRLSSMTFSSTAVAKALCTEVAKRPLDVEVYLQTRGKEQGNPENPWVRTFPCLAETGLRGQFKLLERGGKNWLNHGKVILALSDTQARMTSSSANFSSSGFNLHYDNWLILQTDRTHPIAQANICFFESLKQMGLADGRQDKALFQKTQAACGATEGDLRFVVTPRPQGEPSPLNLLLDEIKGAKDRILIAAHRITDQSQKPFPLIDTLIAKAKEGVKIRIIFDDDTLIAERKLPGFKGLQVNEEEIRGMRRLAEAGADIRFIDSNEAVTALMHNKYMIIDGNFLFTGAGNFSLASLSGRNIEQFYVVRVPEILAAYERGWDELYSWGFDAKHFTDAVPRERTVTDL
jgi:phosphatidylserine/phosphatidylglycerophosphate/cardiolipin synthase-like enzyme